VSLKQWRHLVEICAFAAAGLWAFYVFVYEERIKPLSQPQRITIESSAKVQNSSRFEFVTFTLILRNPGGPRVDIAAEEIDAVGMNVRSPGSHRNTSPPDWNVQPGYYLAQGPLLLSSGMLREGATHGIPGRHILLRADEAVELYRTVAVRRGQYDAVKFNYVVIPGKAPIDPKLDIEVRRDRNGAFSIANGPQDTGELIVPL